jgi:phosphoesterase RecJ-like protein
MWMTTTNHVNWDEATQAVRSAESILLVTHVFPDGDAIGSLLGLANALRTLGKPMDFAVDGGVPDSLTFLPGAESVQAELTAGTWDLMISLDASDEERTGEVGIYGRANSKTIINLDHHATNTLFGDIYLINSQSVAAAEIVFRWLQRMGIELTEEIARPLLTGLVTDTLGFRISSVTANTLGIAQALMTAGASLAEVTQRALDSRPFSVVKLWREALQSMTLAENGVISVEVTQEDYQRAGVLSSVEISLAGFLIRVKESKISVVFRETEEGEVTLSFRSRPGFDVAEVAFNLGGGGHKQASGATIPGPLADAKARVLRMLDEAVQKGKLIIV